MNRLAGITILIADDNALTLEAQQNLLELSGASVSSVQNGKEVLTELRLTPDKFDVILIDINMPVMDGVTATKTIRQDQRFDNLPIIAVTADSQPEDQLDYYKVGMNGHIAKPINLHRLCESILAVLNNQQIESNQNKPTKRIVSDDDLKKQLLERFGNKPDLIISLLPLYAQEFIKYFNILKNANDIEQIKQALHALKGISSTIGADDVYDYVEEHYQLSKNGQLSKKNKIDLLEMLPQLHAFNLQRLQNLFTNPEEIVSNTTDTAAGFYLESHQREKIIDLLSSNDLSIIEYIKKLHNQHPNDSELSLIRDYVEQLKFRKALNIVVKRSLNQLMSDANE